MKKVLQVVSTLKKNGTETFIMNVFRNIDRSRLMFDFLTFNNDKDGFYDEIIFYGSQVFSLPPRKASFIRYHKAIDSFFATHKNEYEAIHIHGMSHTSIAPAYYAAKHGFKNIIGHIHGSSCQGIHNRMLHSINRIRTPWIFTRHLACSDKALLWGYPEKTISKTGKIITNGIDLNKFKFNEQIRRQKRAELGIDPDTLAICHIGAFNPIKNHTFLIDVFLEALTLNPDSRLFLVGEGPTMPQIKDKIKTLGIEEKVIILGRRDDINKLLQAFDIMIMPSLHEGLPFALLEAQASNLPAIASNTISQEAKILPSLNFIDLKDSPRIWAEKAIYLSKQRQIRDSSANEAVRLMTPYSIENTVNSLLKIYGIS